MSVSVLGRGQSPFSGCQVDCPENLVWLYSVRNEMSPFLLNIFEYLFHSTIEPGLGSPAGECRSEDNLVANRTHLVRPASTRHTCPRPHISCSFSLSLSSKITQQFSLSCTLVPVQYFQYSAVMRVFVFTTGMHNCVIKVMVNESFYKQERFRYIGRIDRHR
jgi:hypothetical protein